MKYLVFEVLYLSYLLVYLDLLAVSIIGFLNISHVEKVPFLFLLLLVFFNDT